MLDVSQLGYVSAHDLSCPVCPFLLISRSFFYLEVFLSLIVENLGQCREVPKEISKPKKKGGEGLPGGKHADSDGKSETFKSRPKLLNQDRD